MLESSPNNLTLVSPSRPTRRPLRGSLPDGVIDQVVLELNALQAGAALDLALRMGKLIVDRCYGGDLTSWRKHTTKETSFRRLAARADQDLRVSPTGLYRAVALYELTHRIQLPPASNLGVAHLRLVLGLPDTEQRTLLLDAERQGWTADRLALEAARIKGRLGKRTGRPAVPPLVKVIRNVFKLGRQARGMVKDSEYVEPLSLDEVRAVHRAVEEARQDLEFFQRDLLARTDSGRNPNLTRC